MPGPHKKKPTSAADYFETVTHAVFQSGISWRVVDAKAVGMREAFYGFDPKKVAAMKRADVERLMKDTGIIRNRRKIEATIDNAHTMLDIEREFGTFKRYLRSFGSYEDVVADLIRRFRWLGESGAYYFLYVVGEPVPSHEDWVSAHGMKHAPRRARKTA